MADRFVLSLLARESSSSEPGDKTEGRKIPVSYTHLDVYKRQVGKEHEAGQKADDNRQRPVQCL